MTDSEIKIRPARKDDSQRIWEIRNSPSARANSNNPSEIDFPSHERWFQNKYFSGPDNYCFVIEIEGKVSGYCRFDLDENNDYYLISIAVDPLYSGRGFGTKLLIQSLASLPKGRSVIAEVKKSNINSYNLFLHNGFKLIENIDEKYFFKYF